MSDATLPHPSPANATHAAADGWFKRALASDLFYSFRRSKLTVIAAVITLLFFLLAIFAPLLSPQNPFDPAELQLLNSRIPPLWFADGQSPFLLGTDEQGRDVLSAILYGLRISLVVGILGVVFSGALGIGLGLIAGYFGGALGFVIMRLIDLCLAFPGILLALAVSAILGPGLENGVIAIAVILVPVYARLVEGATAEVRHLPYVDAAVTLGSGAWWIILRHILPNVSPGIIVLTTTWLGISTLWIAALGFIGLGVQPPTPEWGEILSDGQNYITVAWWITVFPGTFLSLFVIGVNLIGDGLRDELDPTLAMR